MVENAGNGAKNGDSGGKSFDSAQDKRPKKLRVLLRTFGCQMNEHDSGRVKDLLLQGGYSLTERAEDADVILFNTCSVRAHAEERVFNNVAALKKLKQRNPKLIIGILGCMAEAQKENIFRRLPNVDFLCGPRQLDKMLEIIDSVRCGATRLIYTGSYRLNRIPKFSKERRISENIYVKIMEGCSNFCSYCIVPYVRGLERSRPSEEILTEVSGLLGKGVKRITLLGQNVNSYGKNLKEKIDFPALLRKICKIVPQNIEIDFVTSHPKDAGAGLFKAMADLKALSKNLHLPLQSGSNKILKRMNRGYTVEKYKNLVKSFRKIVKGGTLTTDLIVGFPGETRKDFEDTVKAVNEIRFDAAYIFKYSPRPFTKAGLFKDDVPEVEKEKRHALLLETQKRISLNKRCQ